MTDWIIAIGGTGSRCAESIGHLAAARVFPRRLNILLVDLDRRNGNLQRTHQVLSRYHAVSELVGGASMFARGVEHDVWSAEGFEGNGAGTFGALMGRDTAAPDVANFLDTFFPSSHYDIELSGGCYQKPEVGAIALRMMLRQSIDSKENALRRALESMADDLRAGREVRVFVVGSVFGGTGASGLPFFPRLLRDELPELFPEVDIQAEQLMLGAVLVAPYFQWTGGGGSPEPNAPDPNRLRPHAKDVLLHYAQHPPGYEKLYVVGAPELFPSGAYAPSGQRQLHAAHYTELTAGLAALDFFTRTHGRGEQAFYYAESTVGGDARERRQLGVNWKTLPFGEELAWKVRTALLRVAVTARFASDYVLPRLRADAFERYPWFEDGVRARLPESEDVLISETFQQQLRWLREMSASITDLADGRDHPSLFPLQLDELAVLDPPALDAREAETDVDSRLRRLVRGDRAGHDFHWLCNLLDDGTVDANALESKEAGKTVLGRLLFYLERAVAQHLKDESETIAQLEPAVPGEELGAQSRFLPRIRWEPGVEAQIGAFTKGGPELLRSLADHLDIGDADGGASNPISSPWARVFLFETALLSSDGTRRRAVEAWRGLMGILAFRLDLGKPGLVRDASVRLDRVGATYQEAHSLQEFAREAASFGGGGWFDSRLLLLDDVPIAATSPLTLLVPSARLERSVGRRLRVPWLDPGSGRLHDPAPYLDRHGATHRYLPLLKAWIEQVLIRPPEALFQALAGKRAVELVQRELRDWSDSPALAAVEPARATFEMAPILGPFFLPAIPAQKRNLS